MSKHYWLAFVIAGGFAASTGFPVQSGFGILDLYGLTFLAQFLVFVGFCGVAVAVAKERIDLRRALGLSLMVWLLCAAISEAGLGGIKWVLPFPVILMVTWPRGPLPDEGMLSHLPEPIRVAIAVVSAMIGANMLTSGADIFRLSGARFDYFEIFTGSVLYGFALTLLLAPLTRQGLARLGMGSYAASLLTFSLVRVIEIATAPLVQPEMILNLVICAMLVTQAWRHFMRSDGWLKIIETLVGGIILSLSAVAIIDWYTVNTFWIILGAPFMLIAAALTVFGMFLIWTDRIWVRRFFRPSPVGAPQ